jgi:hypothetical protein
MKKTPRLIIHPKDPTTSFLTPIHKKLKHKTILTEGADQDTIFDLLQKKNRLIFMGHGSAKGLFSLDKFPSPSPYVIGDQFIELLRSKKDNIFIWCFAADFAREYQIPAFCTGMFISEKREAIQYGLTNATEKMIEESNHCFVEVISAVINKDISYIYDCMKKSQYALLANTNPVAKYNLERIAII